MRKELLLWLMLLLVGLPVQSHALNNYPIVLVHGWIGWGEDELYGYPYWGGANYNVANDIESHLSATTGTQVHTAAVGPISSNWDRACELYAQILGRVVDYGASHSAEGGHNRYGEDFTGRGLFPEWGQDINGAKQKVHLLAHSMGGPTGRLLIHLLENGDPLNYDGSDPTSLFAGGKADWVSSLTTLASPHDGTTLANGITQINYAEDLLGAVFVTLDTLGLDDVYDMKLQHFNIHKQPGQSWNSYLNNALSGFIRNGHTPLGLTLDHSGYDLSPEGMRALNGRVSANPDVYYFSWAAETTKPEQETVCGWKGFFWMCWKEDLETHEPENSTQVLFKLFALLMGNCTENDACPSHYEPENPVSIDASWHQNDGIVNTRSAIGPTINTNEVIVNYNGSPQKGKWNYMGVMNSMDHFQMTGVDMLDIAPAICNGNFSWLTCLGFDMGIELISTDLDSRIPGFYRNIADQLSNLPQ